eukprot:15452076-Alexandrium_andersonii.AAC.1
MESEFEAAPTLVDCCYLLLLLRGLLGRAGAINVLGGVDGGLAGLADLVVFFGFEHGAASNAAPSLPGPSVFAGPSAFSGPLLFSGPLFFSGPVWSAGISLGVGGGVQAHVRNRGKAARWLRRGARCQMSCGRRRCRGRRSGARRWSCARVVLPKTPPATLSEFPAR